MPAMLDDPTAPRMVPAHGTASSQAELTKLGIEPRTITLRDGHTVATTVPFVEARAIPENLRKVLWNTYSREIEGGDTYPMLEPLGLEGFVAYWFGLFAAIMIRGDGARVQELLTSSELTVEQWEHECLGTFYVKPNYPGRSSHVCNAGFLVTDAARGKGVGSKMGEAYLVFAPRLGYTYSVFNLVYETNTASVRIWDGLGFDRIGRVPGAGKMRSSPDKAVDSIVFGKHLTMS